MQESHLTPISPLSRRPLWCTSAALSIPRRSPITSSPDRLRRPPEWGSTRRVRPQRLALFVKALFGSQNNSPKTNSWEPKCHQTFTNNATRKYLCADLVFFLTYSVIFSSTNKLSGLRLISPLLISFRWAGWPGPALIFLCFGRSVGPGLLLNSFRGAPSKSLRPKP